MKPPWHMKMKVSMRTRLVPQIMRGAAATAANPVILGRAVIQSLALAAQACHTMLADTVAAQGSDGQKLALEAPAAGYLKHLQ